jgi:hypothetical protein
MVIITLGMLAHRSRNQYSCERDLLAPMATEELKSLD